MADRAIGVDRLLIMAEVAEQDEQSLSAEFIGSVSTSEAAVLTRALHALRADVLRSAAAICERLDDQVEVEGDPGPVLPFEDGEEVVSL